MRTCVGAGVDPENRLPAVVAREPGKFDLAAAGLSREVLDGGPGAIGLDRR